MRAPNSKFLPFRTLSKSWWSSPGAARPRRGAGNGPRRSKRYLELLEDRAMLSHNAVISGEVFAAGDPWVHAQVTLYQAGERQAKAIGRSATDANGHFDIDYRRVAAGSQLYVVASNGKPADSSILFVGVAGEVGSDLHQTLVVNEYTTVSSIYTLSQFIDDVQISGASPGLDNAFATTFNLVDAATGTPGSVVSNENNGASLADNPRSTLALQTLNTLADALAACVADDADCETLFDVTTVAGMKPTNTIEAMLNVVHNPTSLDNQALFNLALTQSIYEPRLADAPEAWIVALHYTEGGFNAPGRIDFDAQGNVWSNNNFQYPIPSVDPGMQVVVLSPTGEPIFGSPIVGNGVLGSGYGIAIAPNGNVWIGNTADNSISEFAPDGTPIRSIPSEFGNLDFPMGMAFDQQGNLWIANLGDSVDPQDFGSVTVYLKGNPNKALTFTRDLINPLDGIHKPFSIAIDQHGRAWVANSGVGPVGSVSVLELKHGRIRLVKQVTTHGTSGPSDDQPLHPFGEFASPRTIAIDSNGDAWLCNFEDEIVTIIDGKTFETTEIQVDPSTHGWGLAVDGSDRVWVASFTNPSPTGMLPPVVSVIQGNGADGNYLYSFSNPALQHVTAIQLDSSGNVWAVNNWALDSVPGGIIGGDGLVEFVGLATPVKTPLADQNARAHSRHSHHRALAKEIVDAIEDNSFDCFKRQYDRTTKTDRAIRNRAIAQFDESRVDLIRIEDRIGTKNASREDSSISSIPTPRERKTADIFDRAFASFGVAKRSVAAGSSLISSQA